jgi:hypothetical protein
MTEKGVYLDIGPKFLDDKGFIPQDIMSDALHPTTKGMRSGQRR